MFTGLFHLCLYGTAPPHGENKEDFYSESQKVFSRDTGGIKEE